MSWLSKSLRNKLIAGSLLAVLALILLPILYAWSAQAQDETFRDVAHTNQVLTLCQADTGRPASHPARQKWVRRPPAIRS